MALVTSGLLNYWNPKDGIKAGNILNNLAPSQSANPLNLIGGTVLANGGIQIDNVDDSYSFTAPSSLNSAGAPFTFEYLITPRQISGGDYEVMIGGIFIGRFTWGDFYFELYNGTGTYSVGQITNFPAFNTAVAVNITFTYNGTTLMVYANGVQAFSQNYANLRFYDPLEPVTGFSKAKYFARYRHDLHAIRLYNRALSAAELVDNYNVGLEIGLSAPVVPQVKVAEFRAQSGEMIPIYRLSGHEATEAYRLFVDGEKCFIPLVLVTDPAASRIRLQTSKGLRAWKL